MVLLPKRLPFLAVAMLSRIKGAHFFVLTDLTRIIILVNANFYITAFPPCQVKLMKAERKKSSRGEQQPEGP